MRNSVWSPRYVPWWIRPAIHHATSGHLEQRGTGQTRPEETGATGELRMAGEEALFAVARFEGAALRRTLEQHFYLQYVGRIIS